MVVFGGSMKDIKIFVAHTCGQDNQIIDNPLYVNVIGGAVNEKRNYLTMLGDNTGDNISELNKNFSEYSVIYWAWKNRKCDYYGLCHYRRFLSFSDKKFRTDGLQVIMPSLSPVVYHTLGLDNEERMRREIEKYDMIVPFDHDVVEDECRDKRVRNAKHFWLKYHASYLKKTEFDMMLDLIKKYNPEYLDDAISYMQGTRFRGFNCFIMKKELFDEFCEYVFPMLFEFHEKCDRTQNSTLTNRNVGYAGEWFFSIWVENKIKSHKYRIKETQLIGFADTKVSVPIEPAFHKNNVPIVLSVSKYNFYDVAVTIKSIIDNSTEKDNLDFVLLHQSLSFDKWHNHILQEQLDTIKSMAMEYENVSIRDFDPKCNIGIIELGKNVKVDNEELYYLSLLPWIMEQYDTVIWLSDTMMAKTNISHILKNEKNGKVALATKDLYFIAQINGFAKDAKEKYNARLKIKDLFNYFSSDIVVMDVDSCRKKYNKKEIAAKLIKSNCKSVSELFNTAYEGNIGCLEQEWNPVVPLEWDYYAISEYFPQRLSLGSKEEKMENRRSIHGVALDYDLNIVKDYIRIAKSTPFYEKVLSEAEKANTQDFRHMKYDINNVYIGLLRTKDQEIADKYFPLGSLRRNLVEKILPQGTSRQKYIKEKINIFLEKRNLN